ncbi:MAG: GYDIA family GHMP kinase [Saprospiraceae bacterium]|nr:GYDIA family GHMP kinase [Saprospiraceae bacterium]
MKSAFQTHAQGKLLITGEYFVLDGATALAVPVRFGQSLSVTEGDSIGKLSWQSLNPDGSVWFGAEFAWPDFLPTRASDENTAQTLTGILRACQRQNFSFFVENQSFRITTQNDFPREWGLGTSSTLIAALARWAMVDPYPVLFETLGGSGYDIACAYADGPILYRLEGQTPRIEPVRFAPEFSDQLYFVFLGKKQNSREGIARYRERVSQNPEIIEKISRLTQQFLAAKTLVELDSVLLEHELLVSETIGLPRAKDLYFKDFWGEVKSLGAWGGDFVLVTSERSEAETRGYFKRAGKEVFMGWGAMV